MFSRLEEKEPDHFAVKQYKKYKLAAGKTAKSILISCGAILAPFDIKELRDLMEYDDLELDTLGDRKTALFLIIDICSVFNVDVIVFEIAAHHFPHCCFLWAFVFLAIIKPPNCVILSYISLEVYTNFGTC